MKRSEGESVRNRGYRRRAYLKGHSAKTPIVQSAIELTMLPRAEIENLLTAVFEAVDLAPRGAAPTGIRCCSWGGRRRLKARRISSLPLRRKRWR